jgi:hypothetical protein
MRYEIVNLPVESGRLVEFHIRGIFRKKQQKELFHVCSIHTIIIKKETAKDLQNC